MTLHIAVFVGSLRKASINRRLAGALARLAPPHAQLDFIEIGDLPLYNQDQDANPPEPVQRLKREIAAADAVIFVSPEYNRSIPGVLKNAIDWASRPYGKNSFAGKPGALIGISPGPLGTATMQPHLRNVLAYLDVPTLGQPEVYLQWKDGLVDDAGEVTNEQTRALLQRWVDAAVGWFETVYAGRSQRAAKPAG